jgi:UDP-3-O-[3-hydroxymyristoyl] glucosamine N-acyltransferase
VSAARTVSEIAAAIGGVIEGDGERLIRGVVGLELAGPEDISFLANRRYTTIFRACNAGCVLVGLTEPNAGQTVIRCEDPYLGFARVLELFHPRRVHAPGVHPTAVVEPAYGELPAAEVDGATVLALAFVGAGAKVGAGSVLHPHSYVGIGAKVGKDCVLMPGSVVADGCVVGDRVVLNPGAVVGGEGFGFVPSKRGLYKIPQTGRAVIGDDVEIGANSCVDRAAIGDTVVGNGTKIDNFVQIGHGATVGDHCLMVSYAGVAGSTTLGDGVVMAVRSMVLGHLDIGNGVQVGAYGLVTEDTPAGARRSGIPAIDHHRWLQVAAATPKLPDLAPELAGLRRELELQRGQIAALQSELKSALKSALADRPGDAGNTKPESK